MAIAPEDGKDPADAFTSVNEGFALWVFSLMSILRFDVPSGVAVLFQERFIYGPFNLVSASL
jgi:hypothetical protein